MAITDYIEAGIAKLFPNAKGRDAKGFIKNPVFKDFPEPTFSVESPDCGPPGSTMDKEYTQVGADKFPELKWSYPDPNVKEYVVVVEDPDAPLPTPVNHGWFYDIPATKTSITHADIELAKDSKEPNLLAGGFRHGQNLRGTKYSGPKPLLAHGPHRYWYTVIALKEPLGLERSTAIPKREVILPLLEGKVLGWGRWEGVFERKWE